MSTNDSKNRSIQITERRFALQEHVSLRFVATPEEGHKPEDLLKPEYWSHIASQVKPGCIIEAVPETGEWFMELYVVAAARTALSVCQLRFVELTQQKFEGAAAVAASDYQVKWGGPVNKWQIVRKSDNEIIKSDLSDKATAERDLSQYLKALEH